MMDGAWIQERRCIAMELLALVGGQRGNAIQPPHQERNKFLITISCS